MRLSDVGYVRARTLLSSLFGRSKAVKEAEATKLTKQEQEKLRRILPTVRPDAPKSKSRVEAESYDTDEILDYRIDADSIRARGFLKYRYNYKPPSDVKDVVLSIAKKYLSKNGEVPTDISQCRLQDNSEKMKVIVAAAEKFKHWPTNSRLMHLKSVQDVIDFYEEPVSNITNYAKLSRTESKPANVYMMEHAFRFHPEDIEAWHGGVTAFPGTGGKVFGLRNKRLLRQFKPKADWFDYEDQTFDYTPPEKDMPWDNEIARRMDRYPDKRFDLKRKQFIWTK
ncbi:hypothetical protein V3C99_011209 [Haemonchus contortus]|uniref:Large ribosomal subunit protein mL50 n=1 Tax=Haemonchus contortus TaxID=6289 RepID=A0A7I4Y8P1_HAECO|nr:39S ribosomal subunit domain containing protein [Haemonchus contortus]